MPPRDRIVHHGDFGGIEDWRAIPLDPDASDLEDRADHLKKVLSALSVYVTAILDDTAQNLPGGLDLRHIDALLSDLASDVTGTIQRAADAMASSRTLNPRDQPPHTMLNGALRTAASWDCAGR